MLADILLRAAYCANIAILVPVVYSLAATGSPVPVFGAGVSDSPGLRLLVTALWGAILACSVLGLFAPRMFIAIMILQVIYKSAWLAAYVWPQWRAGLPVPWGPAVTFAAIVVVWPIILIYVWQSLPLPRV